jgi:phosphomevalonate kinase
MVTLVLHPAVGSIQSAMENTYTTIVSAPGKVLMAGGYLVLDRQYSGLVVATSSRFYCAVKTDTGSEASVDSATITVRAGQFPKDSSTWSYRVSRDEGELRMEQIGENGRNKFVEITLVKALQVAQEVLASERGGDGRSSGESVDKLLSMVQGMDIVVVADNDFYSQREQVCRSVTCAKGSADPGISSRNCLYPLYTLRSSLSPRSPLSPGLYTRRIRPVLDHLLVSSRP